MRNRFCAAVLPEYPRRYFPKLPVVAYRSVAMAGLPLASATELMSQGARLGIMAKDLLDTKILFTLLGREMRT